MPKETKKSNIQSAVPSVHKRADKSEYSRDYGVEIPRAAFSRVVRQTLEHIGANRGKKGQLRISPIAVLCLQRYAEKSIGDYINNAAHIASVIGKTETLTAKHLEAASKLFESTNGASLNLIV